MADFSEQLLHLPPCAIASSASLHCLLNDQMQMNASAGGAAVWPSANRAIYIPVLIEDFVTAYQMAFEVVTQSGNYDVGIYDELGVRLVSLGSTAVPAAGIATANITDTPLTPGVYFLAMACNNTTVSVRRQSTGTVGSNTVSGLQDQDTAFALPSTATFSAPAAVYYPNLVVALRPTI